MLTSPGIEGIQKDARQNWSSVLKASPAIGNTYHLLKTDHAQHLISHLFPYNLEEKYHAKLSDGLKEYKMLLVAAQQAMASIVEGKLSNFDALVGENSCQIRATLLLMITQRYQIDATGLLTKFTFLVNKVDSLLHKLSSSEETIQLKLFLETEGLHFNITTCELFLISSYILTHVRVLLPNSPTKPIVRNENTDTRKVKEISAVGSTFARDLIKKLRQIVSSISVHFVQEIAEVLPLPESMLDMVSDKYCVSHDKFGRLRCLPCFWYTLLLMHYSLMNDFPLVLVMDLVETDKNRSSTHKMALYFKVVDGVYQEVSQEALPGDTPSLVILGSSYRKISQNEGLDNWKNEILKHNPVELILAYAASHRQYPDESKDVLINEANSRPLAYYRSKAVEWGCTIDNPSLFFLVHAYCDQVKNIFSDSSNSNHEISSSISF